MKKFKVTYQYLLPIFGEKRSHELMKGIREKKIKK